MKSIKDILAVIVGLAALVFAVYEFYRFATFPQLQSGHNHLWLAIGGAVVAFVCGLIYFLGHVNKEEEIHITQ